MTRESASRRGQRVYDRWASAAGLYRLVDRGTRGLRRDAVADLAVEPGDTVVDLGCGPGASLPLLAEAVAPGGRVIGIDYSAAMVRRATRQSVPAAHVVRADAVELPLATDTVDGVFASLALSAMPDLAGTLDAVERVLAPGGRLVVVDGRTPGGPVGTAIETLYRWLVNYQNGGVLSTLRARYDDVELLRSVDAGLGFVARATPDPPTAE